MRLDAAELLSLVGGLYEAAAQPELWDEVLPELARHTGSCGVVLHLKTTFEQGWGRQVTHNMDPAYEASMRDYYCTIDPWFERWLSTGERVQVMSDLVPTEELRKTEYYADWWQPQGVEECVGVAASLSERGFTGLTAARPVSAGRFEPEQLQLLRMLQPRIDAALHLEAAISTARGEADQLGEVLEGFDTGVVLLDALGRVLRFNARAQSLLTRGDGLRIEAGALSSPDPVASVALARQIGRVSGGSLPVDGEPDGWISLTRSPGRRPLAARVAPLRGADQDLAHGGASIVVLIRDPESEPESLEPALQRLWGLTRAESRSVALLVKTGRVEEAAERSGIRPDTTREHLKSAFRKTSTRGQAELVSLVLRTVGNLRPPDASG